MKSKLIPPDLTKCQAEKPNGNTFMTLGGSPGLERCKNKPTTIVKEINPGKDGNKGSMSLCTHCLLVFMKQMKPKLEEYDFEEISRLGIKRRELK